jgi:Tol biopolymer transport system component
MKFLRAFLFFQLLAGVWFVQGGNALAQEDVPLPGQFVYVEDGSRLFLVRGDLEEPLLLVQAPQEARLSNPHFSADGRYLAFCLLDPQSMGAGAIQYLDMLTLEKHLASEQGPCEYDWSPDGRTLIYATGGFMEPEPAAGYGIWSHSLANQENKLLIPSESPVIDPRWSPDGKTISYFDFCFECVGQFHTYDLDTGETSEWSEEDSDRFIGPDVDWSPDGQSLAFDKAIWVYADESETHGLSVAGRDGQTGTEIHSQAGRAAYFPLWSPDGEQIAFASFESFTIGNYLNRRGDLMTVAPDGSNVRTLYSSSFEVFPQAWSPDGRYLLFVQPLTMMQDPLSKQQLVLLDVETGQPLWDVDSFGTITADWAPLPSVEKNPAAVPVAGKDGILFVGSEYALTFYEPVSGQLQKLTAPFSGHDLSVSPDGQTILFGNQILTLTGQTDGTVTALGVESDHPRQFSQLNWSPDSRTYAYVEQDGPAWIVDILGKRTELPGGEMPPEWSFDGRWMAYCDKTGKLWIAEQGKPADWIIQRDRCYVKWSPTQSILAYSTHPPHTFENNTDGTAFLYDPISGRTREVAQNVSGVGWSPDGRLISAQRITWMGASNYMFSISAIDPQTGQELLIEEFNGEGYGNQTWIEQNDGYIVGRHRFQVDLMAAVPLAEILFDATKDGSQLLVASSNQEGMSIGCLETTTNRYHPLMDVVHTDTPSGALPGVDAHFSPDRRRAWISDFVDGQTMYWLAQCGPLEPVSLPGNARPQDLYFSPEGDWLVLEQTVFLEESSPRIILNALAGGIGREVPAGLNTHSTWFRMPEPPEVPPTAAEQSRPTTPAASTQGSGPINLQNDIPNRSGRSLIVLLLVWAGMLIAVVVLAYLLWKRSLLAKVERLVIFPETAAGEEAVDQATPAGPSAEEVQAAFQQGVSFVRAGQAEEGVAELRKVVAAEPENNEAWFWLAIAAVRQKSYRLAERCFLQARKHGHPEADKALEWLHKQL